MSYEVRWVKRRKIKSGMVSTSKVLQFRVARIEVDSDDYCYKGWSEWMDVPVVDEESASSARTHITKGKP